jgi:hypothetical protein
MHNEARRGVYQARGSGAGQRSSGERSLYVYMLARKESDREGDGIEEVALGLGEVGSRRRGRRMRY